MHKMLYEELWKDIIVIVDLLYGVDHYQKLENHYKVDVYVLEHHDQIIWN